MKEDKQLFIIDVWVSWCGPCLRDIDLSHNLRKEISEKYNIQWIYISIDKELDSWKMALNDTEV